jgi:hypothetical protein
MGCWLHLHINWDGHYGGSIDIFFKPSIPEYRHLHASQFYTNLLICMWSSLHLHDNWDDSRSNWSNFSTLKLKKSTSSCTTILYKSVNLDAVFILLSWELGWPIWSVSQYWFVQILKIEIKKIDIFVHLDFAQLCWCKCQLDYPFMAIGITTMVGLPITIGISQFFNSEIQKITIVLLLEFSQTS